MPRQSKICGLKSCGIRFYRSATISAGGWSVQEHCCPKHWRMAWREKHRKVKPTFKPKGDGLEAKAAINKFLYGRPAWQEIGDEYGVSHECVRQGLKKRGITGADSGRRLKSEPTPKLVHDELWLKLRAMHNEWQKTPIGAYKNQRAGAKWRGIGWELTLAEWWGIWEKSGKYGQRGRNDRQYVMCRIRDFGPYSKHSVVIKTCNENGHERRDKRGKRFGGFGNEVIRDLQTGEILRPIDM